LKPQGLMSIQPVNAFKAYVWHFEGCIQAL
jgi:hypothetical protein